MRRILRNWCEFALLLCTATSYYVQAGKGFPTISAEIQTSTQAWKLIEQDYTLRLSLVAHEWATEHLRAWNAVFAEGRKRGNAAYCGPALVEMEIADADKRAEWCYRTCCEIWEIQGRIKCRAFFRAIFDWGLQSLFATREGCFRSGLELHQKRTGARIPQDLSAIGGHMKREMGRLRAKWNTKLEIATRDSEYRKQQSHEHELKQRRSLAGQVPAPTANHAPTLPQNLSGEERLQSQSERMTHEQVNAIALTFTWRELEDRFRDLQAKTNGQRFSATVIRTEWDSGATTEDWFVGGNRGSRKVLEHLATIAVRKLGYALKEGADTYWFNRVREWVRKEGLDKDKDFAWCPTGSVSEHGETGTTQSLQTERIVELSAMFCVELMALGIPESAVSPPPGKLLLADGQSRPGQAKRKTSKTKAQLHKTAVIFGAIQSGLTGPKYCISLDDRKVRLPNDWKEEGCPDTYAQAYKDKQWRKRIQDEKCRYREQYEKTSARERESIIQGESGTRRARR